MSREFEISIKTPKSQLKQWGRQVGQGESGPIITRDIILNAKQLAGGDVDWDAALPHIRCETTGGLYWGERAVRHGIARTIGSIASRLGYDMHSPHIVYLCGDFFALSFDSRASLLDEGLAQIDTGSRRFVSEEKKEQAIERERSDIVCLRSWESAMREAIVDYADQNQLDMEYLQVLLSLLYLPAKHSVRRGEQFDLLRRGEYGQVLSNMRKVSPERF